MSEQRRIDNFTMRVWLETIEDIVGPGGLKSILNYSNLQKYIDNLPPDDDDSGIPVEDYKRLTGALFDLFGGKGTRSLKFRAGREFVRNAMEKRRGFMKALSAGIHLLPEKRQILLVLEKWKEQSEQRFPSQKFSTRIELKENEDCFLLIDRDYPESDGITSTVSVCGFYTGALSALVEWATGHLHEVVEIECRASGYPADVFRISKGAEEK